MSGYIGLPCMFLLNIFTVIKSMHPQNWRMDRDLLVNSISAKKVKGSSHQSVVLDKFI